LALTFVAADVFPGMREDTIHQDLKLYIKRCLKKNYNAKYRKKD
jgi:hypothetical protein